MKKFSNLFENKIFIVLMLMTSNSYAQSLKEFKESILCFDQAKVPYVYNFISYEKEKKYIFVKNESGMSFTFLNKLGPPSNGIIFSPHIFLSIDSNRNNKILTFAIVDPSKTSNEQKNDIILFESIENPSNIIKKYYCPDAASKLAGVISK